MPQIIKQSKILLLPYDWVKWNEFFYKLNRPTTNSGQFKLQKQTCSLAYRDRKKGICYSVTLLYKINIIFRICPSINEHKKKSFNC